MTLLVQIGCDKPLLLGEIIWLFCLKVQIDAIVPNSIPHILFNAQTDASAEQVKGFSADVLLGLWRILSHLPVFFLC